MPPKQKKPRKQSQPAPLPAKKRESTSTANEELAPRFEGVFQEEPEHLGAAKYYSQEEKCVDRKISRAPDNPMNLARLPHKRRAQTLILGDFDWGTANFAAKYKKMKEKGQLPRDPELTGDAVDCSRGARALWRGHPTTRPQHSLWKRRIAAIKAHTLAQMASMNIRPPPCWRPGGPAQQRQMERIFSPPLQATMVHHDYDPGSVD